MNYKKMRSLPIEILNYIKEYIPQHIVMYSNKSNYSFFGKITQ